MTRTRTMRAFALIALPLSSAAFSHVRPYTGHRRHVSTTDVQDFLTYQRRSVVLSDSRRQEDRRKSRSRQQQQKKWPTRIFSKILKRKSGHSHHESSQPLYMMVDQATDTMMESSVAIDYSNYSDNDDADEMIMRNFEQNSPLTILPRLPGDDIDTEFFDVSITQAMDPPTRTTDSAGVKTMKRGGMGLLAENMITGLITRHSVEAPVDLNIRAQPQGRLRVLRGQFCTDCTIDVGKLVLRMIRMSSGRLQVNRMTLNLLTFCPGFMRNPKSRFPEQFDLHATDFTFTRDDLLHSSCIRNGLRTLLVRILKDRGFETSTVKVTSIDILPSGKIACEGEAKTLFGSELIFEVRSGISTSCRGHVLTFPGLEISLNRDIGFFVPVPNLDVDVGHNTRFRQIEIDGDRKELRVSASVTITPARTIRLNEYKQTADAFAAKFSTDVGQWLTRICRFS